MEEQYTSLQEEVEVKSRKLKQLWAKFRAAQQEVQDLQLEQQQQKEDLLLTVRELTRQLQLQNLVIESFVPPEEVETLEARAVCFSSRNWQLYCGDNTTCQDKMNYFALSMDVVTKAAEKLNVDTEEDVTYVTSVSGSGPHLLATGGASLYRPTSAGFRVYLSHAPTAEFAKAKGSKHTQH